MVIVKTSLIRIAAALILFLCLLAVAHGQTPREIAQKTLPSVVLIIGENNKGKAISLGSGFFVREDIIATNNHVTEGASNLYAKTRGSKKFYALKLIIARPRTDLALLRIVGISKAPLLLANFNQVEIGDEVYAVGNPSGLEGTFSQGLVSGLRKTKDTDYLQISAPISHGSSGGPILNKSGEVIGVAVGGIETNGNLNFAIPVSELSKLMEVINPDAEFDLSGIFDADKPEEANSKPSTVPFLPPSLASSDLKKEGTNREDYLKIKSAQDTVHRNPQSAEAYFKLGQAYANNIEFHNAITAYETAIRLNPNYVEAYIELGFDFDELGLLSTNPEEEKQFWINSLEAYKQALRQHPDDPNIHRYIGNLYERLDRKGEAIGAYKAGISLAPNDILNYYSLGNLYLSLAREQISLESSVGLGGVGSTTSKLSLFHAIEAFSQIIKINPKSVLGYDGLGEAHFLNSEYDKAIEDFKTARIRMQNERTYQMDENYSKTPSLSRLREIFLLTRNYSKGIDTFKQLVQTDFKDNAAHYSLGIMYLALEDKKSALEEYKILKSLKAENLAEILFQAIYK